MFSHGFDGPHKAHNGFQDQLRFGFPLSQSRPEGCEHPEEAKSSHFS